MTPKILAGIAAFGLSVALMLDKSWWFLAALAVGTALLTTKIDPSRTRRPVAAITAEEASHVACSVCRAAPSAPRGRGFLAVWANYSYSSHSFYHEDYLQYLLQSVRT